MKNSHPVALHAAVEAGVNAGDVDAVVALYESDAALIAEDGSAAVGRAAIKAAWSAVVRYGGHMTLRTRSAIELGDLALLSNHWTFELDGAVVAGAITAEVARRQPDGSWRYVIDHPYAAQPVGSA